MNVFNFENIVNDLEASKRREEEELCYNTEMIGYQNDPMFIDQFENLVSKIYTAFDTEKIKSQQAQLSAWSKNKVIFNLVNDMEKLLSDRFGLHVVVGSNDIINAFTYVCGGLLTDNLMEYIDWSRVDDIVTKYEDEIKTIKPEDVTGDDRDMFKYYKKHMLPYDIAKFDLLKTEGIHFDLAKAKILNARDKKGFRWYINADFWSFRELGISPRETVAILLHELGHAWTWTEYNYKTYRDIQILQDIVREEYGKKNKSLAETISVYYQKVNMKKKPSGKTDTELIINTTRDILDRNKSRGLFLMHTSSTHEFTDSEQQADEFASRFGLGPELVTGLGKLGVTHEYDRYYYLTAELTMTTLSLCGLIAGAIISNVFLIGIMGFLTIINGFGIKYALDGSMYGDMIRQYDDYDSRVRRLKHSTKRRLKYIEDPETKSHVIKHIDAIDKQLRAIETMKSNSLVNKIFMYFNGKTEPYKEYRFEEMVEDLLSNDLHYLADKFKELRR